MNSSYLTSDPLPFPTFNPVSCTSIKDLGVPTPSFNFQWQSHFKLPFTESMLEGTFLPSKITDQEKCEISEFLFGGRVGPF